MGGLMDMYMKATGQWTPEMEAQRRQAAADAEAAKYRQALPPAIDPAQGVRSAPVVMQRTPGEVAPLPVPGVSVRSSPVQAGGDTWNDTRRMEELRRMQEGR